MPSSFEQRLARAAELGHQHPPAREVLGFYAALTRFQKRIFEEVSARAETRVESLVDYFPELLKVLREVAPPGLVEVGAGIPDPGALIEQCWGGGWPADWFFGRALVQPFAESLASRGQIDLGNVAMDCPFCGAKPAAAVRRGEGDGGKRSLVCSLCSTEWAFRRILCPNCGEEDKNKLPVYVAKEFPHVCVEACDSCGRYIKAVDLTVDGRAVPLVDEVATLALNIWAEEHGYSKVAPNIVAM
jgi:FdhE protein